MIRATFFTSLAIATFTASYFGYHTWRMNVRNEWTYTVSNDTSGADFPCEPTPYDMTDHFYRDAKYDWASVNGKRDICQEIQAIDVNSQKHSK